MQDRDLDALFATARADYSVPPALMARVLADADALQPRPAPVPKPRFWAGFMSAIGGVPALAGLSTATLAGLWIGFVEPSSLSAVADVLLASSTVSETLDVMPAFDDFLTEG